jgi:MFS transporter, OCT family, solute carrier family 22 (organic cation transporter), member 4/5
VGIQDENTYPGTQDSNELTSRVKRELVSASESKNECQEWIYDYGFLFGYRSMTSEFNWVCQNAWKSITGQSAYFIGSVAGTLTLGILADVIGRLPVLVLAHLAGIVGNGLTIFATDEITFAICRFISGMATDNNFVMMYILVMEYTAPRMRTIGLNLCIGVFYCLGSVVTPWLAVWLGNWRLYLIATIVPGLVVPLFYFIIPESAQWLISRKQTDKALVCYQKIAKFNRKNLDDNFAEDFRSVVQEINVKRAGEQENPSMIGLFRTPRLRRLTMILFFKS